MSLAAGKRLPADSTPAAGTATLRTMRLLPASLPPSLLHRRRSPRAPILQPERQRWHLLALAAWSILWACEAPKVEVEPLWSDDVVAPNFGDGGAGGEAAAEVAPRADTMLDGGDGGLGGGGDGGADGGAGDGGVVDGGGGVGDGVAGDGDATGQEIGDGTSQDIASDAPETATDAGDGAVVPDANPADTSTPPTIAKVWSEVIQPWGCATPACHGSKSGSPLFVDQFSARAKMVGQPAQGPCAPGLLVVPGDADKSVLLRKIDPKLMLCGLAMPSKGGVDAEAALLVRQWISAGAQP